MNKQGFRQRLAMFLASLPFAIGLIYGILQIRFVNPDFHTIDYSKLQSLSGQLFITPSEDIKWYENILFSNSSGLNIRMYDFTYDDIKEDLKQLASIGVDIKLILENNKYNEFSNTFAQLQNDFQNSGISMKSDDNMGTKYVHAKTLLFNDKFIIQTANFTNSSFNNNREYFFLSYDKDILRSLKIIFEKDWNGEKITEKDIHPNLLICNIDCRGKIESLLQDAQKSIYIQAQDLQDKYIINILKQKKDLDIKIILADLEDNKNIINVFGDNQVRIMKTPYLHAKNFLIDDKYLVIGSINFTTNSMDNNREIAILIKDFDIINQRKNQFFQDWEN